MGDAQARRRWNAHTGVLVVWTLGLLALGSAPGFAGPSYPFALIVGILIGPVGAGVATAAAAKRNARGIDAVWWGLGSAGSLFVAAGLVATLHGVRVGFCAPAPDYLRLFLGPGVGAVLAGVWGALVAQSVKRPALRMLVALALPLGSYALSFARFYTSPMVFAFDHFVGYFAGTLYDTELGSLERLWTYRAGTCGLVIGLVALTLLAETPRRLWVTRKGTIAAGALGFGLAWGIYTSGPQLGHYQTAATIDDKLGERLSSARCDLVYDASLGADAATLLARECDAHIRELEQQFEIEGPQRVRVIVFGSADQKAALMGARHVYVAKPWREEVYINAAPFPHPVLRHELAHVMVGVFGQGPFKVAGSMGGFVPDPGRIEGIAVMAAPSEDEVLTEQQWSAAMLHLDLLPPLGSLFQLGFFGTNSSTAYTVAGAFLAWVAEQYGIGVVKAWYGGAPLDELTKLSWRQLEASFRASLQQISVNQAELAAARSRFERPAVLQRRCPHQVDEALSAGLGQLGRRSCDRAETTFQQVLAMDPSALRAQLGLAECQHIQGNAGLAEETYRRVATSEFANSDFKAAAWERAGDLAWQQTALAHASQLYRLAQNATLDEDQLRQLDIKLSAVEGSNARAREAIASFFFGFENTSSFPLYTGEVLGRWQETPPNGLGSYLLGRQYLAQTKWKLAATHFEIALQTNSLGGRVRREALRSLLVASCATQDRAATEHARAELMADHELSLAQRVGTESIARRCTLETAHVHAD